MSYVHCTEIERGQIEVLRNQGMSCSKIARILGRHPSTISREVQRNGSRTGYVAQKAQGRYQGRRKACRPKAKLEHPPLREYVAEKIAEEDWSPELVAGRLVRDHGDRPEMQVCHETIYRAIYSTCHYLRFLREFLPQARPKRRKRGQGKKRRAPLIPNRVSIAERPEEVEQRSEPGHWEGDTVVGKAQDGYVATLVERRSRMLQAVKLETKQAAGVRKAIVETLLDWPTSWVKTITFDNGSEFSEHEAMTQELGVAVYFADPYSAYQRGSNEQVNGLLRRYLPKGASFKSLTQDQLDRLVQRINQRPRKCLGYRTPTEVFEQNRQNHFYALRV